MRNPEAIGRAIGKDLAAERMAELRAERDRYRAALGRVWDALTAEDKRGALTDTLWMPDENCTVFEFIDHTLNPK